MQELNLPLLPTFETATTINTPDDKVPSPHSFDPLENAFKEIFPQNTEENTVIKMCRILGKKAQEMSDEQIQCLATEFQFLIDAWLDEYEKDIFNGMTLKEVLNEK